MIKKNITALAMATFAMAAHIAGAGAFANAGDDTSGVITLEAESGKYAGNLHLTTEKPGYSGAGYVSGIQTKKDVIDWDFSAPPGLYRLTIRFRCTAGPKAFTGRINGHGFSGTLTQSDAFLDYDASLVELASGANRLQIGGGWGWYDIDRVLLTPASRPAPPLPVPGTLSDPAATPATRALMARLVYDYGKYTWAGQHDRKEVAAIRKTTGREPVIISGELADYTPSRLEHGARPGNEMERYMELANAGHVLELIWHWNAPANLLDTPGHEWYFGFYTHATTFDFSAALADPQSPEYALLLRDIDAIAVQLKKASDQNIPILWRPLHEASGGHFWWGARGPAPFKALWRLLHDRLTVHHQLHNLIWILTNIDPEWYPGDDVVDMIGVDNYPEDAADVLQNDWQPLIAQFNGVKPIALTEFGGIPDIERMHRFGVWFAYFSSWNGDYIRNSPASTMTRIYRSQEVITLDEYKSSSLGPASR